MAKEKQIWTTEQLEKLKALRDLREASNAKRRADIKENSEFKAKRDAMTLKVGDKVKFRFTAKNLPQKMGVIVKIRTDKKTGSTICDARFSNVLFEGIPEWILRKSFQTKANIIAWVDKLEKYVKLAAEYQEMPTKKLLSMYKANRFTDEGIIMKHELSKREHVEKRSEKKQITVKWEEFSKQSKALSFRLIT